MKKQDREPTPPPEGLSEGSTALWREIVTVKLSPSRAEALTQAMRCRDRLTQIQAALAGAELVVETKRTGAAHLNPLIKAELETRRQLASLWAALNLNWRSEIDGRRELGM